MSTEPRDAPSQEQRMKKKQASKTPRLWRHYSGVHSGDFWMRVNALPWHGDEGEPGKLLYERGCELQELESAVLQELKNAEKD